MTVRARVRNLLRPVKWAWERRRGERHLNRGGAGTVNIIDVGAVGWLPRPWDQPETAAMIRHLLRFEPIEAGDRNPNVTTLPLALWSKRETRPFYLFGALGGSASLLEQNYDYVATHFDELKARGGASRDADTWLARSTLRETRTIEVWPLDEVLAEYAGDVSYHLLKIDAQGAELPILQGAEGFLRASCIGLHLELFEVPLLKGVVLKDDVVAYLSDWDFELVRAYPHHGTFNSQRDCIFLKRGASGPVLDVLRAAYGV